MSAVSQHDSPQRADEQVTKSSSSSGRRVRETLEHYSQIIEALEAGRYDGLERRVRRNLLDRLRADQAAVQAMITDEGSLRSS